MSCKRCFYNTKMNRTLIIAEIGECFNGNLSTAGRLIQEAREAGCDIVKFQTLDYENIALDDPERDWFFKIALYPKKIRYLISCADKAGIRILFSPENIKTAQWLLDSGLNDVKIASSLLVDDELLRFVNKKFRRVFISTGMASIKEIKKAIHSLDKIKDLYIMHCISEYPTGPLLKKRGLKALAPEDARLNMMKMLKQLFPSYKVGYSDHTDGILAPVAAAAMGADVIEKHITLDRKKPIMNFKKGRGYLGTDHILSIEPGELKEMVRQIREVEVMLGSFKWERSAGERILRRFLINRFRASAR